MVQILKITYTIIIMTMVEIIIIIIDWCRSNLHLTLDWSQPLCSQSHLSQPSLCLSVTDQVVIVTD